METKRKSRQLERRYRKSGPETDRIAYQARRYACDKIMSACTNHVRQKIESNENNIKVKWYVVKKLLYGKTNRR